MHWWSLNVITSRTHESPILEARRGAAIVRSIIDPPAPRLNVKSLPRFNTIRSFLATISPTKIPLLSKRASPHSVDLLLVTRNKGPPTSLFEAFLKEEDLGLEDLERIVRGEVAALHAYPRHLYPNEPRVGLQEIRDAQIRAADKDPTPP